MSHLRAPLARPQSADLLDPKTLHHFYRQLYRIRRFEEVLAERYPSQDTGFSDAVASAPGQCRCPLEWLEEQMMAAGVWDDAEIARLACEIEQEIEEVIASLTLPRPAP